MFVPVPPADHARVVGLLADAFGHAFIWAVGMALVAILPAIALLRAERGARARGS
jgi:hypothetical protein